MRTVLHWEVRQPTFMRSFQSISLSRPWLVLILCHSIAHIWTHRLRPGVVVLTLIGWGKNILIILMIIQHLLIFFRQFPWEDYRLLRWSIRSRRIRGVQGRQRTWKTIKQINRRLVRIFWLSKFIGCRNVDRFHCLKYYNKIDPQ